MSRKFTNGSSVGEAFTEINNSKCYQNYPGITLAFEEIIKKEVSTESKELNSCAFAAIIWNTFFLISITGILVVIGPFKIFEVLTNTE